MTVTAVVGTQWGDEGKGRIIDFLAERAHVVIRYQGGDNAGHTVVNSYGKHALHLVPSGIFNPATCNIIGTGCVVNPASLLEEMSKLSDAGVRLDNLWVSSRAHMLMPYHRMIDGLEETSRGPDAIGTTKRGIGPVYADKASRSGLRIGDLLHPDWLQKRISHAVKSVNLRIRHLGGNPLDEMEVMAICTEYREKLGSRIVDTVPLVRDALHANQAILLEGQLGIMRDIDWGIYPYVTSSNPSAAFACVGAGLPPMSLTRVLGVVKAYSTAVGDGPLPVELFDASGEKLRQIGSEFGATTGRPRRCGWFDGVAIRYSAWMQGLTGIVITKLDVLDDFDVLKICVGYRMPDGKIIEDGLPATPLLYDAQPVYEEWAGWKTPTTTCRRWKDLPQNARRYISRIRELAGVRVDYVSVGPARDEMFEVQDEDI